MACLAYFLCVCQLWVRGLRLRLAKAVRKICKFFRHEGTLLKSRFWPFLKQPIIVLNNTCNSSNLPSSPIEVSHELRVRYSDADVTMKIHSVRALRLMCLGCLLVLSTPLIPLAITGGISLYISLSPFLTLCVFLSLSPCLSAVTSASDSDCIFGSSA